MTPHHIPGEPLTDRNRTIRSLIRQGSIILGGNKKLKIYGTLDCKSGKRMRRENRVFFGSEEEAVTAGYRPCGHCLREKYQRHQAGNY